MRFQSAVAAVVATGFVIAVPAAAAAASPAEPKIKVKAMLKGETKAKGTFQATITRDTLCYALKVNKLNGMTEAHIHFGAAGTDGPVAVTIEEAKKECLTAVPDAEDTGATLSESELAAITADPRQFYVDAHSEDFPQGEIRGQLR